VQLDGVCGLPVAKTTIWSAFGVRGPADAPDCPDPLAGDDRFRLGNGPSAVPPAPSRDGCHRAPMTFLMCAPENSNCRLQPVFPAPGMVISAAKPRPERQKMW
jgi:hypothetical protein